MERSKRPIPEPKQKSHTALLLVIVALLMLGTMIWLNTRRGTPPVPNQPEVAANPQKSPTVARPRTSSTETQLLPPESSEPRQPKPMKLESKILVSSEWNSSSNAFGLDAPPAGQEGATVGPASVAYAHGNIYVLDNVNKRVMRYDEAGKLLATITLPTKGATDITTDRLGAVVVIDHYYDRVYKLDGDVAVLIGSPSTKKDFPIGTKFDYDTTSNTLSARDVDADGLARIDGNKLMVAMGEGKEFPIAFEAPVACVEEVMSDSQGIIWVLYTLEGDYRIRRLARIDPALGSAEVAKLDVWFAFDATRHMAPAQNGVVVFAGDGREGRLISFAYAGND